MQNPNSRTNEVSDKLKALSHPCRLSIVQGLASGESNVSDIQRSLGIPQPSISAHLSRLRSAGIIAGERRGQEIHYHVVDEDTRAILKAMTLL